MPAPGPVARTLARALFDNAALFPPARAPMEAALALHRVVAASPWSFAAGRFLVPAGALQQLATERALLGDGAPIDVGIIVGSPADPTASLAIDALNDAIEALRDADPQVRVAWLEYRPADQSPGGIARAAEEVGGLAARLDAQAFVEVSVAGTEPAEVASLVSPLSDRGAGAKARCGGVEPGMVPTTAALAAFVSGCVGGGIPFKATAGLHHALASGDGDRHGYLNVLAATALAAQGNDETTLEAALAVSDRQQVAADRDGLTFAEHHLGLADLDRAREQFIAFGTCSFTEPLDDLLAIDGMTTETR